VIKAVRCDFDIRPIGGAKDSLDEGMYDRLPRYRRIERPCAIEGTLTEGARSQKQQNEERFHQDLILVVVMISPIAGWMPISR
jgi:hypothetical protein